MERSTQFAKIPHLGSCFAPPFEVAHPQAPSQPLVYFGDRFVIFRYAEVLYPAAEIFCEFLHPVFHGDKPRPPGQFFGPPLEFAEGFIRPVYFGSLKSET